MRPAVELSTPSFVDMSYACIQDLKPIFRTTGEVFVYAANGHGAWEAAIANVLGPGERVLVPESGHFGIGWRRMAERLGATADAIETDWRHALDPQAVEDRLRADAGHEIKAVLAVQVDTATGIVSDIQGLRAAMDAASHPALLMVDTIASLGAVDFRMDEWRVDVAVAASQKALMSPPGLGITAASQRALETARNNPSPRDYWDWEYRSTNEWYDWFRGTAPEHLLYGLREAIDMIAEEGLGQAIARHTRLADATRAAVAKWGEEGTVEFNAVEPQDRSDSVTTIRLAERYHAPDLHALCRDRFNVSLGGGLGELHGRCFRIAHMGDVNEPTVLGALASVETAMVMLGIPHASGGVTAAIDSIARNLDAA